MERDFMGLAVKQEIFYEPIDPVPVRSSAMQWSFSNKGSPQLLSFHGSQEGKPKTGFDSLASTGLVTITTSESFDSDRKSFVQKSPVPEKQGEVRYTVTNYPSKHVDAIPIRRSITNPTNLTPSLTMSTAINQPFIPTAGQSLIGSVSPQQISVLPATNLVPCTPSMSPVVGTTDLRTSPKISGAPAQLTIFYNGSVCVYDNISPEKAQAIMLLAGNAPPATSTSTPPSAPTPALIPVPVPAPALVPVQASTPRSSPLEGFVVSQSYGAIPLRSSPVPSSVVGISLSATRSASINDLTALKPAGVIISPSTENAEPLKSIHPLGSARPTTFLSTGASTVPQFRRKSLARFLERRKERVISTSPYGDKQSVDCSTPGDGSTSVSPKNSGLCPVKAMS